MKSHLLLIFILCGQLLIAQTFTEVPSQFEGVALGSIAFSDVDGDGDEDVLITGKNSLDERIAKLYTNDGAGSFTQSLGTPFEGVYFSKIAFADVDGDGDKDVLITGNNSLDERIAKLYTNDGTGSFSEAFGTPFDGVFIGSVAFSDVDGDGDEDVLITGRNSSEDKPIAKLYINDGTGSFSQALDTPFQGVVSSSIAFSDMDGDGDEDVLITGSNSLLQRMAKLYTNDGTGSFSQALGTPFDGVLGASIAFSDVDMDGDKDVLITGGNNSGERIAKLYTNDGTGSFSQALGTPFDGVYFSSIAFSDVDIDGDEDVLITGENNSDERIAELYTNDGTGSFSQALGTPFDRVYFSSIAFSDVDGDGDEDVLITGNNNSGQRIAKLYINDGSVSVEDLISGLSFEFMLYPNPTKANKINIGYTSEKIGSMSLMVFDVNGHLLIQKQETLGIGEQTFSIDISSLPQGSFFIQLDDGHSKGVQKFQVQ